MAYLPTAELQGARWLDVGWHCRWRRDRLVAARRSQNGVPHAPVARRIACNLYPSGLPTLPAGLLGFNGTAAELQATLANAPQEAEGGGFQAFLGSLAECYERCGKGAAPAPAPAGGK